MLPKPFFKTGLKAGLAVAVSFVGIQAQAIQITGRVLERAAMDPVPGATVYWKGTNLHTTTDSLGQYTLSGTPVSLGGAGITRFSNPYYKDGLLKLNAKNREAIEIKVYDVQGETISRQNFSASHDGMVDLPVLSGVKGNFVGFMVVKVGAESYRFKVLHHSEPASYAEVQIATAPVSALSKTAAGGTVNVSMTGLVTVDSLAAANTQAMSDIVMSYPARTMVGVGLTAPYGAKMLFDGTKGAAAGTAQLKALWHEWWRFPVSGHPAKDQTPAGITFKMAHDPQYPGDTNHVTLQMCCESTTSMWGYSDIQENEKHGSVQIHAEWLQMGRPSSTTDSADNPDSTTQCTSASSQTSNCWNNSGVYVQSRFEIQIQSNALSPTTITNCHEMGSVVNEYAPAATSGGGTGNFCTTGTVTQSPCLDCGTSNQNKKNGIWQSYDVTFRTAGWRTTTTNRSGAGDTNGLITAWWNGVKVHHNRKITGAAAGISNHSGEEMNDTLYGLKLQDELGDVRFRNVWIKKLKIDSLGTNFYY